MTESIDPAIYKANMVTVDYSVHIVKVLEEAVVALNDTKQQLGRVWDLHANVDGMCAECHSTPWPCATIDAMLDKS